MNAISDTKDSNYAFIVIFGKHELVKGELPWAEDFIVAEDFAVKQREICPDSKHTTFLYDSTPPAQHKRSIPQNKVSDLNEWGTALKNAEMGVVTITAPDAHAPASFSEELIVSTLKWSKSGNGILTIPQAIELLGAASSGADSTSLIYNGGRRRNHFPFAIC